MCSHLWVQKFLLKSLRRWISWLMKKKGVANGLFSAILCFFVFESRSFFDFSSYLSFSKFYRNQFYQIFYGVFENQFVAMDALLTAKESFARQVSQFCYWILCWEVALTKKLDASICIFDARSPPVWSVFPLFPFSVLFLHGYYLYSKVWDIHLFVIMLSNQYNITGMLHCCSKWWGFPSC